MRSGGLSSPVSLAQLTASTSLSDSSRMVLVPADRAKRLPSVEEALSVLLAAADVPRPAHGTRVARWTLSRL